MLNLNGSNLITQMRRNTISYVINIAILTFVIAVALFTLYNVWKLTVIVDRLDELIEILAFNKRHSGPQHLVDTEMKVD